MDDAFTTAGQPRSARALAAAARSRGLLRHPTLAEVTRSLGECGLFPKFHADWVMP